MSSGESDEEFQSADEGSDEDIRLSQRTENEKETEKFPDEIDTDEKNKSSTPLEDDFDVNLIPEIEKKDNTKNVVEESKSFQSKLTIQKSTEDIDINKDKQPCLSKESDSKLVLPDTNQIKDQVKEESIEKKLDSEEKIIEKVECAKNQIDDSKKEDKTVKSVKAKESKIGMKKPREKLGERLGNKKIGSRVTKPLVGISSDSLVDKEKEPTPTPDDLINQQPLKDDPMPSNFDNDWNMVCMYDIS